MSKLGGPFFWKRCQHEFSSLVANWTISYESYVQSYVTIHVGKISSGFEQLQWFMADSDAITFCMLSEIWQISEIKRSQLLNEFDFNLILTAQFYFYGQNSIINEPEFNLIKENFSKFLHWSDRWFCNKSWQKLSEIWRHC